MRQSDKRVDNFKRTNVTGQDFSKHSSSEGAPSDCSDEAFPGHSLAEEDEEQEGNLLVVPILQVAAAPVRGIC